MQVVVSIVLLATLDFARVAGLIHGPVTQPYANPGFFVIGGANTQGSSPGAQPTFGGDVGRFSKSSDTVPVFGGSLGFFGGSRPLPDTSSAPVVIGGDGTLAQADQLTSTGSLDTSAQGSQNAPGVIEINTGTGAGSPTIPIFGSDQGQLFQTGNAPLIVSGGLGTSTPSVSQDSNFNPILFQGQGPFAQDPFAQGGVQVQEIALDQARGESNPLACTVTRTVDKFVVSQTTNTLPVTVVETEFSTTVLTSVTTQVITTAASTRKLIIADTTVVVRPTAIVTDTQTIYGSSVRLSFTFSTVEYTSNTFVPKTEYLTTTVHVPVQVYRTTTEYVRRTVTKEYILTATNLVVAVNTAVIPYPPPPVRAYD